MSKLLSLFTISFLIAFNNSIAAYKGTPVNIRFKSCIKDTPTKFDLEFKDIDNNITSKELYESAANYLGYHKMSFVILAGDTRLPIVDYDVSDMVAKFDPLTIVKNQKYCFHRYVSKSRSFPNYLRPWGNKKPYLPDVSDKQIKHVVCLWKIKEEEEERKKHWAELDKLRAIAIEEAKEKEKKHAFLRAIESKAFQLSEKRRNLENIAATEARRQKRAEIVARNTKPTITE